MNGMTQVIMDYKQRLHAKDMMALVTQYRSECIARDAKPKRVFGVYNQNNSLVNWALSKRDAENS